MSFFSLFGNKAPRSDETLPEQSGSGSNGEPSSPGSGRKLVRLSQRELLYGTVRDVMIRAGVLVATYRFKVLSLDSQGRQYLIMMDLFKVDMRDMKRLGEIEAMIVQAAKVRHDLVVTGVYWRNDIPTPNAEAPQTRRPGADATGFGLGDSSAGPISKKRPGDENDSVKQSVPRGAAGSSSKGEVVSPRKSPRSSTPQFEDTQAIEPTESGSQLSATQYGDLA